MNELSKRRQMTKGRRKWKEKNSTFHLLLYLFRSLKRKLNFYFSFCDQNQYNTYTFIKLMLKKTKPTINQNKHIMYLLIINFVNRNHDDNRNYLDYMAIRPHKPHKKLSSRYNKINSKIN